MSGCPKKLLRSLELFPKRPHLVGVYALGKAQRIIGLLRQQRYDKEIFIHGALEKLCNYYIKENVFLGKFSKTNLKDKKEYQGEIILAPPSAIKNVWSRKFEDPIICQASGWMSIKQRAKQSLVELPLIISDHADWNEILTTIKEVSPKEVWITHGAEEALIYECSKNNLTAKALSIIGYESDTDL